MANDIAPLIPTIITKALPVLRETAVLPRLVRTDLQQEVASKGDTIQFPMPQALGVSDVVPGALPTQAQDVDNETKKLVLDQWKKSDFYLTDKQMGEIVSNPGYIEMEMQEAVRSVANNVNQSLVDLFQFVPNIIGDTVDGLFAGGNLMDATAATTQLNKQLVPRSMRNLVISNDSYGRALDVPTLQNANNFGSRDVVVDANIPTAVGFSWDREDYIQTRTASGTGDNTVNGANAKGSLILNVTVVTTIPGVGSAITIAGDVTPYAVLAVNGSALTLNRGLSVATTGGEAIAVSIADGTVYEENCAFRADAFGLAIRLQTDVPAAGQNDTRFQIIDPVTQMALMVRVQQQERQTKWEVSTLYGVANLKDEYATRLIGGV